MQPTNKRESPISKLSLSRNKPEVNVKILFKCFFSLFLGKFEFDTATKKLYSFLAKPGTFLAKPGQMFVS